MNLQRLHDRTPHSFCSPLGWLPNWWGYPAPEAADPAHDGLSPTPRPLNIHAKHCLLFNKSTASTWFQNIRFLCLLYMGWTTPLSCYQVPLPRAASKAKSRTGLYPTWEKLLQHYSLPNSVAVPFGTWEVITRVANTVLPWPNSNYRNSGSLGIVWPASCWSFLLPIKDMFLLPL